MKCKEIMTKAIKTCDYNCNVKEAAQIMKKFDTGAVPVVDAMKKPLGVITDRDITINAVAEGNHPENVKVLNLMTKHIISVHEDDPIDVAARKMKEYKIRRILVVDDEDRLKGIISLADFALHDKDKQEAFEILEQISEPITSK